MQGSVRNRIDRPRNFGAAEASNRGRRSRKTLAYQEHVLVLGRKGRRWKRHQWPLRRAAAKLLEVLRLIQKREPFRELNRRQRRFRFKNNKRLRQQLPPRAIRYCKRRVVVRSFMAQTTRSSRFQSWRSFIK